MIRDSLVTDMVNISKVATSYKIDLQQNQMYFDNTNFISINKQNSDIYTADKFNITSTGAAISDRRNRERIWGFIKSDGTDKFKGWGQKFVAGDIMRLNVEKGPYAHLLEGLCLSIKKRSFLNKETAILIRNVLFGVGVEITASYYNNRLYKCGFSDYKRKQFEYVNHKLYYLRQRDNRETQV